MHNWFESVCEQLRSQPRLVLVSIIKVAGSAPREVGAKMLVTRDRCTGTIGGGRLEQMAFDRAHELLADDGARSVRISLALGAALGQCCGGRVELLLEVMTPDEPWLAAARDAILSKDDGWICRELDDNSVANTIAVGANQRDVPLSIALLSAVRECYQPTVICMGNQQWLIDPCRARRPEVWLFGAGHVGRALVQQLLLLQYRVVWIDQRATQLCSDSAPSADDIEKRLTHDPLDEIADIPPHASVLVMTHSHDLDYRICLQLLQSGGYKFIGLIGSDTKSARFRKRLLQRGLDPATIHCPIAPGVLRSRRPESIALAIAIHLTQLAERA